MWNLFKKLYFFRWVTKQAEFANFAYQVSHLRELGILLPFCILTIPCNTIQYNTTQQVFAFGPWPTIKFQFWPSKRKRLGIPKVDHQRWTEMCKYCTQAHKSCFKCMCDSLSQIQCLTSVECQIVSSNQLTMLLQRWPLTNLQWFSCYEAHLMWKATFTSYEWSVAGTNIVGNLQQSTK